MTQLKLKLVLLKTEHKDTEELAKKHIQVDKVGEQVEHVDALNGHNTEEESVTKIKHVPPNMEKDYEHFTISETKHYIFLNLLLSILTTHLDGKLHLNDLMEDPGNLKNSAHTRTAKELQ